MRPRRITAIAVRDLRRELKGRRGWVLPVIAAALLLPASLIGGSGEPEVTASEPVETWPSEAVTTREDGVVDVRLMQVPDALRERLDGPEPELRTIDVRDPIRFPGRTMYFALVAASILTGALSESIAGERSQRTLQALLSAAVTRAEVVTGKWLAWSLFGTVAALCAVVVALAAGTAEPGWWIAPLPLVPAATVALGLYLVRRAADVVAGATISLRILPAALSILAGVAFVAGQTSPWLGAAIPIGGAVIASGDTWPTPGPPLLAAATTLAFTGWALFATQRDLEEMIPLERRAPGAGAEALWAVVIGGPIWWAPVFGPLLWTIAGNEQITRSLRPETGILAGGLGLCLYSALRAANARDPRQLLDLRWPTSNAWSFGLAVGVALAFTAPVGGLLPLGDSWLVNALRLRSASGLAPGWAGYGTLLLAIVGQETVFRGWLRKVSGPWLATLVWVVVIAPFAPLRGILAGAALTLLATGSRSILPGMLAVGVWGIAGPWMGGIDPLWAAGGGIALLASLAVWARFTVDARPRRGGSRR